LFAVFYQALSLRAAENPEAHGTLARAGQRDEKDEKAVQNLSPALTKAIEPGERLTPAILQGIKQLEANSFAGAQDEFRSALAADPQNVLAARLLAKTLVASLAANPTAGSLSRQQLVEECDRLCRQFPADPDLELHRAHALDLAGPDIVAKARANVRKSASDDRAWRFALLGVAAIAAGASAWLAVMFLLAVLLAICIPRAPDPRVTAAALRSAREVWLERFYLLVLSVSLFVFYLTVPVVSLGLLAITMVLSLFLLPIAHLGILQRGFFASRGVIRGMFRGPEIKVQGIPADEKAQPRLFAILGEVAERLETSPVDTVYLTPNAAICVYQTGSGPFGLFRRRRVIEIGIPTFSQVTRLEFKSILAHEYGHFSHRDPLYGRFISRVTESLAYAMDAMNAAGGVLTYVNPFYWFYWLYLRAYILLAAGFSRSREFLADRRAVAAFGKEAFVSGLTKISVDGRLFTDAAVRSIRHELSRGRTYQNFFESFRQFRDQPEIAETRRKLLDAARETKPRWFDTHPTGSERIAAVSLFPDSGAPLDARPAADLLADLPRIEEQLTDILTRHVYRIYYPHAAPLTSVRRGAAAGNDAPPEPPCISQLRINGNNAQQVLAAASALDQRGAWVDAIALYEYASQKWKAELSTYAENCIRAIEQKRAIAEPSRG
jgi:Zn-dependent protease with chaperone function